jgi:hypothetical protein
MALSVCGDTSLRGVGRVFIHPGNPLYHFFVRYRSGRELRIIEFNSETAGFFFMLKYSRNNEVGD